ncbi:uncharacterized protein LOC114804598 [Zeugodacus cucurbitae]|uniref:uncharacterized protein LOC114804598 n=1 Tax=Zeugodacus cucurbitae TaxID=28588 RepID=UPI0023D96770|nr:uncharacterized protein LOC114804598 [Zeugodacus cucurbitae]
MSYATLKNTCNASATAEQSINKPNYTPRKALKKACKLLRRFFRPSTSGKVIITAEKQSKEEELSPKVTELCRKTEAKSLADMRTISNALSAEEYENQLNELAELEAAIKSMSA